jgi:hypothetical protein
MRTTVVLPDALFRQVKATAALEGKTLRAFIMQAVCHEIDRDANRKRKGHRTKLPLVRSKRPGSLRITGATVAKALETEDLNAAT